MWLQACSNDYYDKNTILKIVYMYLPNIPIHLFKATFVEMILIRGRGAKAAVGSSSWPEIRSEISTINISDLSLGPAAFGMFELLADLPFGSTAGPLAG